MNCGVAWGTASCAWRQLGSQQQHDERCYVVISCGVTEEKGDELWMEMGGNNVGEEQHDDCSDCGEDGGNMSNANGSGEYLSNLILQDVLAVRFELMHFAVELSREAFARLEARIARAGSAEDLRQGVAEMTTGHFTEDSSEGVGMDSHELTSQASCDMECGGLGGQGRDRSGGGSFAALRVL